MKILFSGTLGQENKEAAEKQLANEHGLIFMSTYDEAHRIIFPRSQIDIVVILINPQGIHRLERPEIPHFGAEAAMEALSFALEVAEKVKLIAVLNDFLLSPYYEGITVSDEYKHQSVLKKEYPTIEVHGSKIMCASSGKYYRNVSEDDVSIINKTFFEGNNVIFWPSVIQDLVG